MSVNANDIFIGEVASVQNYGAFIKIPGNKQQGLVHRTQLSRVPVDDATEVLSKGDKVWAKVIGMDDGKISLSMKLVDQGSGRDLDPNGVQIFQDEQRRKIQPNTKGKKTIQLDAIYNTKCVKCGTGGHLAKDCFKSTSGKTYDILPENDDVEESTTNPIQSKSSDIVNQDVLPTEASLKKKKKKKKKELKKKKKRKRHLSVSSSNSASSEESSKRKSKKHKKRKKN
ncbi:Nucleic acid-binding, OB-fold,S1 domain,RNA-binding domain, S1,Zinc finger, CCHC-type [Cinara cedri]|uniref:Nucleic acid-binding, OB-fold,S1 domain,RNA-binding domain, S1,Zinc finger, CCHC-type n=1 Tax=Cinara cedri TaxID=506608 RepID=A0A5E4MGU5_9HEMI|nr:Nucleic acid-binding, OB-fold,S1 domain,RNA-binding domain, S1,Zinc finger, CCHC-type [Cinara cedri]